MNDKHYGAIAKYFFAMETENQARESYKAYLKWRMKQLDEDADGRAIQVQLETLLKTLTTETRTPQKEFTRKNKLVMAVDVESEKKKDIATFKKAFRSLILDRLKDEWKAWMESPLEDFIAKPDTNPDGTYNFWVWKCSIPVKEGAAWEKGQYRVKLYFTEQYM